MDKEKKLKLMRFWLFGTFVIMFVATSIYAGLFMGLDIFKAWQYWAAMAFAGVASWFAFVVYKGYLDKK